MESLKVLVVAVSLAALGCTSGTPLCADGGSNGGSGGEGGSGQAGGGGQSAGPAICSGNPRGGVEVPMEHRQAATACVPSTRSPAVPSGGLASCATDADCANDAGSAFTTCLHGRCSFDQCLTDADCGTGVCACASDYYGGNGAYHPNVCVPATCHVDADCGVGGFCSPTHGYCGTFGSFHCHGKADSCVDATKDCANCGNACVYDPTVGAFICGMEGCAG